MGGRRVIRVREAGDALAPLFTRFLADETAKWTDVMQKANIKVQE